MKTEAIKLNRPITTNIRNTTFIKHQQDNEHKTFPQKVYASHLGFRGGKSLAELMDTYQSLIVQKTPAVEAFLTLEAPPISLEAFLSHILKNENYSYNFVDSVVVNPRLMKHYAKVLKLKLPNLQTNYNIFGYGGDYQKAYANYIDNRVKNASSISELLTIRPDWDEQILLDKHRELYHNDDFELGIIPESIGANNYQAIINYLRNYMDIGFKSKKNIQDLTINGKTFKFENFIDGKSDKNVFKIETPNGEKYIIKMAEPNSRGLNKPCSLGTLAMIDTYLTRNNCRNSAHLKYYQHNSNTSVYDFIEHNLASSKIEHLGEFVKHMPDFTDLGLYHKDTIGTNNYFRLEDNQIAMANAYDFKYGVEHKEYVSIDNDHTEYTQILSPTDYHYNKPLPSTMAFFF